MITRSGKIVALVLVLAMLLAACGGSAEPTPAASAPADTAAAAPADAAAAPADTAAAPAEAAAAPADAGRTFKVWWFEGSDSAMGISWQDALADFQAMHPDVKVEFEQKTFTQMQQTAQMVLNSSDTPDVMEINKGNGTAGLYASQGLLTNLEDEATARGWGDILKPSIQTTARYNDQGIMGSGPLYGVPTYGEYILVYYNKTMFDERGLKVPTTLEEFNAIADAFVAEGITPITVGGADAWTWTHNWQELVLYKATRQGITDYQSLTGDVDFHNEAFTFGTTKLKEQADKGYFGPNANGVIGDDANLAFAQGKFPMNVTGSWQFGNFMTSAKDFEWGMFLMPGKTYTTGSAGNMWAVPASAKNKDLAYDFINLTIQPKAQTLMANSGGIPVAAEIDKISDPKVKELNEGFATIVANDGLAFYPDWPVPGYIDVLGSAMQNLVAGDATVEETLDEIAGPYNDFKASMQ